MPIVIEGLAEACCPSIGEASLDPAQAADLARMFKALGDPVRLRVLSRITSAPEGEICVCEITGDDFDVSGPTISHHLRGAAGGWPHRGRAPRHLGLLPPGSRADQATRRCARVL